MAESASAAPRPAPALNPPLEPAVLSDVPTAPRSTADPLPQANAEPNGKQLEDVLPEITRLAAKVGGYRRLAEIATQLDRGGEGP